jgi:hypothetical protein
MGKVAKVAKTTFAVAKTAFAIQNAFTKIRPTWEWRFNDTPSQKKFIAKSKTLCFKNKKI